MLQLVFTIKEESQFLGFSFTKKVSARKRELRPTWKYFPTVHKKKRIKLIGALKNILNRRAISGIRKVKEELMLKLSGWVNYFVGAIPKKWKLDTDAWIRRRIRQLLWKQWKSPKKRRCELLKRTPCLKMDGVPLTSNRYWCIARSPQIHLAIKNETLWKEGWACISGLLSNR